MIIEGRHGKYEAGKLVAEAKSYRMRLCKEVSTGRQCLLLVAQSAEDNGVLDRIAYFLRQFTTKAEELEEKYAKIKAESDPPLNYNLGFPEVLDNFVVSDQGSRRVIILAFRNVANVGSMVPVSNIARQHRRIDIKTSAWILGKSLKLLTFVHSLGTLVGRLDATNILIEPDKHYVVLFDWSDAKSHPNGVSAEAARQEISAVARVVIDLLGGDLASRLIPYKGNEDGYEPYTQHLFELAAGGSSSAQEAHKAFYALIRDHLNWQGFYPFTSTAI